VGYSLQATSYVRGDSAVQQTHRNHATQKRLLRLFITTEGEILMAGGILGGIIRGTIKEINDALEALTGN
jgi:hypothetical protein